MESVAAKIPLHRQVDDIMRIADAQPFGEEFRAEVAAALRLSENIQEIPRLRLFQRRSQLGEGDALFLRVAFEKGARLREVELEVVELAGIAGGDSFRPRRVFAQEFRLVLAQTQKLLALTQVLLVDMQLLCQVCVNMHLLLPPERIIGIGTRFLERGEEG
jgi:hypothetical protein